MNLPKLEVALPSIAASTDRDWLSTFRANMATKGAQKIVDAIDKRIFDLNFSKFISRVSHPSPDLSLAERVTEAVRVYEEFLFFKHGGKRPLASRTKAMIKRWAEKDALIRAENTDEMSSGLELLAKYGRIDCAYEQIILDFPGEFEPDIVAKARENLAAAPAAEIRA